MLYTISMFKRFFIKRLRLFYKDNKRANVYLQQSTILKFNARFRKLYLIIYNYNIGQLKREIHTFQNIRPHQGVNLEKISTNYKLKTASKQQEIIRSPPTAHKNRNKCLEAIGPLVCNNYTITIRNPKVGKETENKTLKKVIRKDRYYVNNIILRSVERKNFSRR